MTARLLEQVGCVGRVHVCVSARMCASVPVGECVLVCEKECMCVLLCVLYWDVEIEWSLSVLLLVSSGVRDWLPWLSWNPAANGWEFV